ncbi:uncharacterized protein [Montipora foliosa]|uniref:uncharacterized protein isoform X2 n=1 Tax=Montipora foliosa TaxID=591990 RepID=UPI0035F110E8
MVLKPKEACDETAEVSNSYRKEAAKITDSKQPSEMADIKHELKNVIFNRRLTKGLDHLEILTTPANKPTVEKLKPKEACDETAEVSNSYRKEAAKITDSKQPSEMADIKHELKNVIFNRRLAKGLDHLEIPTTPANKPTVEKVEAIQIEIMSYGPVEAVFTVYEDFMVYREGVYIHVSGGTVSLHAIKMLGWGTSSEGIDYWICANSWGTTWGMNGNFYIRRGTNECGIESGIVAGRVPG